MIDTHAHFTHRDFVKSQEFSFLTYEGGQYKVNRGNISNVLQKTRDLGVTAVIEPAIGFESNYAILDLYERNKGFIYPAVGVHPNRAHSTKFGKRRKLKKLAKKEGVVAIGETGLDYHYEKKDQHRFSQKRWFRYQLKLAAKTGLPLILHIRAANEDAIAILKKKLDKLHGGVVHCFRGDKDTAKTYIEMGFYIGIGGSLIEGGHRCAQLKEAVKHIPLDRILLETDSPYVLPVNPDEELSFWPKHLRNTPIIILPVAEEIARLKNITVKEVIEASDKNAKKLFNIK